MPSPVERRPAIPALPRAALQRVRRFSVEHDLLPPGRRVLVAVSGGPDSTCLLLALAALRRSLRLDVRAAYFDHRLRGVRAADRERRFVRGLCDTLAVPLRTGSGDVRPHARRRRLSLEEAARELRYRFLARAARAGECDAVATGHTRDDQAETVLLHVIRGAGLRGLAAMAPSAPWPVASRAATTPRLVRPLLALSRDDAVRACRDAGLTPVDDASNRSTAHLRNRVRRQLLPLLRRYNPSVDDALVRLAASAAGDIEAMESIAHALIEVDHDTVRLRRDALAALPAALRRHAVRAAYARLLGDARSLTDRHLRAVVRAASGPTDARLDLPRRVSARAGRDAIVLSLAAPAAPPPLPTRPSSLPVPGVARFGAWRIEAARLARPPRDLAAANGTIAYLDADACGARLTVRRRRPGDRFQPLGLARPKKLQDFLVDAHVPRAQRDSVPLVCAADGIAWVVGQRPADWAKVTARTRRVVRLRAAPA